MLLGRKEHMSISKTACIKLEMVNAIIYGLVFCIKKCLQKECLWELIDR